MSDTIKDCLVTVTGPDMTVSRAVSADVAATIIATILTGRSSVGVPQTPAVPAAQPPRVSLREYLDEVSAASHAEKIAAIGSFITDQEGRSTFTKDDVLSKYKLAREAPPANFHRDFATAIKTGWIAEDTSVVGTFYVTQKGAKSLKPQPAQSPLLERGGTASTGEQESARRRRSASGSKVAQWVMVDDLLDEAGRSALKDFYSTKAPNGQNEQVAVLAFKLRELTGRPGFSGNEIYTALQVVGGRTPGNLMAVFGNMATAGLGRVIDKAFHPNFKTDDLVKFDLPRAKGDSK